MRSRLTPFLRKKPLPQSESHAISAGGMKQLSFLQKPRTEHGGSLAKGKRKCARPIATRTPIHIVLRSSRAKSEWSLLNARNRKATAGLVSTLAKTYGVRVYSYANVGNHLHLLVSVKRRESLRTYMRVLTQAIMFAVTGAKKGTPKGPFWDASYYSRLSAWGKPFLSLKRYLLKNRMEAFGFSRTWVDMVADHTTNRELSGFA